MSRAAAKMIETAKAVSTAPKPTGPATQSFAGPVSYSDAILTAGNVQPQTTADSSPYARSTSVAFGRHRHGSAGRDRRFARRGRLLWSRCPSYHREGRRAAFW